MNAKLLLALLVAVGFSSCKQKNPAAEGELPTRERIGSIRMIDYYPPKQSFACLAPAKWSVEEREFAGSESIAFRDEGVSILIGKNPDTVTKDAEKWAGLFALTDPQAKGPSIERSTIDGKPLLQFSRTQPIRKLHSTKILYTAKERHAMFPVADGFYHIRLSARPDTYEAALPVFDAGS